MIRRPFLIVLVLSGINLTNFLDRYLLAAVGPKLQEDWNLSDLQLGLAINAFMVGYVVTSPLFGWLGDRFPRKGLMALGIAGWSLASVASGLMPSFYALVAARFAVGVGEASYATLAPTIIDDLAEPHAKSRWLAVFYAAAPVGSALGYVLGGQLQAAFGWRSAFFIAGGPGILLAGAAMLIREPSRTPRTSTTALERSTRTWVALLRIPVYRSAVIGNTAYTFALGGFAAWAPKYLYHHLKMDL